LPEHDLIFQRLNHKAPSHTFSMGDYSDTEEDVGILIAVKVIFSIPIQFLSLTVSLPGCCPQAAFICCFSSRSTGISQHCALHYNSSRSSRNCSYCLCDLLSLICTYSWLYSTGVLSIRRRPKSLRSYPAKKRASCNRPAIRCYSFASPTTYSCQYCCWQFHD
jgi:hypothetical protein